MSEPQSKFTERLESIVYGDETTASSDIAFLLEAVRLLRKAVEDIEFCPRSMSENIISDMQSTAKHALEQLEGIV